MKLILSSASHLRLAKAREWLAEHRAAEPLLVIAHQPAAAHDLLRSASTMRGATFGWHRSPLGRLAASLASTALAEAALSPVGTLGCEALTARVVSQLRDHESLDRLRHVIDCPGFARAVARCVAELRLAGIPPERLRDRLPALATLVTGFAAALDDARLADRASVFEVATDLARERSHHHPLLGIPTLLLDVALEAPVERAFIASICERSDDVFVTLPHGDRRSLEAYREVAASITIPDGHQLSLLQSNSVGSPALIEDLDDDATE